MIKRSQQMCNERPGESRRSNMIQGKPKQIWMETLKRITMTQGTTSNIWDKDFVVAVVIAP